MKISKSFLLLSVVSISLCFHLFSQQDASLKTILAKNAKPLVIPFKDEKTGLYGYKNTKTGKVLAPAKYQFANAFTEGLGAVNIGGKVVFDTEYSQEYVCKGGKWGYVDSIGKIIIPLKYESADEFHDGFAAVEQNKLKALIDPTGKILTEFKYDYIYPFSEDLAVVGRGKPLKFTYIDKTGKEIIPCDLDEANSFFRGKAKVIRFGATFYINKKGERVK